MLTPCVLDFASLLADTETAVLLFEPGTVINTGDAGGELTAEVEELA